MVGNRPMLTNSRYYLSICTICGLEYRGDNCQKYMTKHLEKKHRLSANPTCPLPEDK